MSIMLLVRTRPRNVPGIRVIWKLWWVSPLGSLWRLLPSSSDFCSAMPAPGVTMLGYSLQCCSSPWCSSWPQCLCHEDGKLLANMRDASFGRKMNRNNATIAIAKFGELLRSISISYLNLDCDSPWISTIGNV